MTVSTVGSIAEFVTNGVTTNFPFYFKFLASEDLVVTYIDPAGTSTTLTLGTHYTANGAGKDQGGSIVTTAALAGPGQLIVSREMEAFQQTSLRNQGKFLAETHEDVFDKLTMLIQQGFAIFKRALTRPLGRDYFFAEGRRIAGVQDPVEAQDATTKAWTERHFSDLIDSVTGLINTTTGIIYDAGTLFDHLRFGVARTVPSIASLRLLSSARNQRAFVLSYYGDYKAGGGAYAIDPSDTTSGDNGGTIIVANDGARWKLQYNGSVCVTQFGAKCDGSPDTVSVQNCANSVTAWHFPESGTCYLENKVVVSKARSVITGLGCIVKQRDFTGLDARALEITGNSTVVDGVTFDANGTAGSGQVTIFVLGAFVTVKNCRFSGNVGHYVFFYHTLGGTAYANTVDGEGSGLREITTAFVFESCFRADASRNKINNVGKGWGIQFRQGCSNFQANGNEIYQKQWSDTKTAFQGQDFFQFDLGGFAFLPVIQIKAVGSPYFLPKSLGYTKTRDPSDPKKWSIQFTDGGRNAGEQIRLAGYSGSENIQINASFDGVCDSNMIDGGGDSGIIVLGPRNSLSGNHVKNIGYAGIAVYGGQKSVSITGGLIADCSQLDDGLSSPDDPGQPSAFCTGILAAGSRTSISGVTFTNESGTMKSAISAGNAEDTLNVSSGADASIKIGTCTYLGDYVYGPINIPNDTTGKRSQSVQVTDGTVVEYPEKINMDATGWTDKPTNTAYWTYTASAAGSGARDTSVLVGGVASLKINAGGWVDANLAAGAILAKSIVKINLWAKRNDGSGYFSLITTLAGLETELRTDLAGTDWRQYTFFVPITGNLAASLRLRFGSLLGTSNFQLVNVSVIRL